MLARGGGETTGPPPPRPWPCSQRSIMHEWALYTKLAHWGRGWVLLLCSHQTTCGLTWFCLLQVRSPGQDTSLSVPPTRMGTGFLPSCPSELLGEAQIPKEGIRTVKALTFPGALRGCSQSATGVTLKYSQILEEQGLQLLHPRS